MGGQCAACSAATPVPQPLCAPCIALKPWARGILEVGTAASDAEVQRAFKQKAVRYHPDKCGGDNTKFGELLKAKLILMPPPTPSSNQGQMVVDEHSNPAEFARMKAQQEQAAQKLIGRLLESDERRAASATPAPVAPPLAPRPRAASGPPKKSQIEEAAEAVLHFKNSTFSSDYLQALTERLMALKPYCVPHTMNLAGVGKVTVSSRPKLVFAEFNQLGEAPLYDWGQVTEDYGEVRSMPEFAADCINKLASAHPELKVQANHFLITYSTGIPGHHDKRFNSLTPKGRRVEGASPLILLNFGAKTLLNLSNPKTDKIVRTLSFDHGDFVYIPGYVNPLLKHSVATCPSSFFGAGGAGGRISVCLRHVDAHWLHHAEGYVTRDGKKTHIVDGGFKTRQPEIPENLATALNPRPPNQDSWEKRGFTEFGCLGRGKLAGHSGLLLIWTLGASSPTWTLGSSSLIWTLGASGHCSP